MALYNTDGTLKSAETVAQIMHERFEESTVPNLSDVLGSDWGLNMILGESYEEAAFKMARRIYNDEAGHLYPLRSV